MIAHSVRKSLSLILMVMLLSALCCINASAEVGDTGKVGQPTLVDAGNARAYIDQNHTLWAWGENKYGQLGNGTTEDSDEPVRVMENVYSISADAFSMMAIKNDGSLWAWGENTSGALGFKGGNVKDVYQTIQTVPVKVMDNVAAVCTVGENGTAVIKKDGTLWLWNGYGESPTKYTDNVIAVSLGYDSTELAFIKADHSLWVKSSSSKTAKQVMNDVIDVAAGSRFILALKSDHTLWTWGDNSYGQLGNGTMTASNTPIKVMDNVTAISATYDAAAAIQSDYTLWAWGNNAYYKLGTRKINASEYGIGGYQVLTTPTKIMDDVVYANLKYRMNAVKRDGTLWTNWSNSSGTMQPFSNVIIALNDVDSKTPTTTYKAAIPKLSAYVLFSNDTSGSYQIQKVTDILTKENGELEVKRQSITVYEFPVGTKVKLTDDATANGYHIYDMAAVTEGTTEFTISEASTRERTYFVNSLNDPSGFSFYIKGINLDSKFSDVVAGSYYENPVKWAVRYGITSGTSATTFSPNQTCTNAHILTFLWRAKGSPEPTINNPFADVKTTDYYYKAALWAYDNGLISGNQFCGSTPCTRGTTVTYLWKLAGSPDAGESSFTDAGQYSSAVAWAVKQGITSGTSVTTFSPDRTCTRGQIVTFLYRDLG